MRSHFLLLIFSIITLNTTLQGQYKYHAPLDIDFNLSGSFGEIRGTHFHGGMDSKSCSFDSKIGTDEVHCGMKLFCDVNLHILIFHL